MKLFIILAGAAILGSCAAPSISTPCSVPVVGFEQAWRTAAQVAYEGSIDWKRPETTLATMRGDCEDIAGLMVALAGDGEVAVIDGEHAIVFFPGQGYVEPQCYGLHVTVPDGAAVMRFNLSEYLAMCGQ